jgi:hypothetical protein
MGEGELELERGRRRVGKGARVGGEEGIIVLHICTRQDTGQYKCAHICTEWWP